MIEAVRLALAAGDAERSLAVLRRYWLRLIIDSETALLEELCLAQEDPRAPHALLIRACCRDLSGDPYGAEFLRGQALQGLQRLQAQQGMGAQRELPLPGPNTGPTTAPHAAATPDAAAAPDADAAPAAVPDGASDDFVRCFAELLLAPDTPTKAASADRAHRALARCAPEDDYPSGLFLLGWTEVRLRRDLPRAIALLRAATEEARLQQRPHLLRLARSNLAFALTHAGVFTEAEGLLDKLPSGPPSSDWDRFEGGSPQSNRGCIAFWRGDYGEAIAQFDSIISEGSPGTNFEALARLYLVLSLIALQREERFHPAGQLLQGVSTEDKHGVPWDTLRRVATAWLAHAHGQDAQALSIARPALSRPGAAVAHALLAELYRVIGEPALAAQALGLARAAGLPRYAQVSTLVTAAALHSTAGQGAHAHNVLDQALAAAAPERVFAPFLSPDPVIADLLGAHARWGTGQPAFLRSVLARRGRRPGRVTDALTEREREVFVYLRTALTIEEIAAELGIAYPTAKTHVAAIYRKLGVTKRRAAVEAADLSAELDPERA